MDLEEQNRSKDERVGSSSPDLFSSIVRQMVAVVCLLLAFTKYVPFDEAEAQHAIWSPCMGIHDRTDGC
jgi:hypothetical protein